MTDLVEFGRDLAQRTKQAIAQALAPIAAENVALKKELQELRDQIASIPAGKDGRDGEAGPSGIDGKDGAPGINGNDGAAGKDGADGKDADPISDERIDKHIASRLSLNPPAPGRDGRDGLQGAQGEKGIDGRNGIDGKDGTDAMRLEDIEIEAKDGGRTITLRLKNSERTIERDIVTAIPIDRGVFVAGNDYAKGDTVSFGGSLWIAQKDQPGSKPGLSDGWRLSVKRGRDGKAGENGKDFQPPKPVKL